VTIRTKKALYWAFVSLYLSLALAAVAHYFPK
jgi:hypothetical protein